MRIVVIVIRILFIIGLIYLFFGILMNSEESDPNVWWLTIVFFVGSIIALMGMPSSKE